MAEEQALVQLMDTLDGLELTKSEYEWLEQRFAAMTEKEQFLFRGAMKLEKPETASGAISMINTSTAGNAGLSAAKRSQEERLTGSAAAMMGTEQTAPSRRSPNRKLRRLSCGSITS